ncbi:metallophosphoesterase [Sphingobacterium siyangense]|uniref:metallophosphoesterase n=1 Tax=Sphingobacterium siyangense TaxID=459529 RepID=UPI001F06AE55|nr:metallophosphoesterase [Sphingobacterium siyangense]
MGDIHGAFKALVQCLERSGFDYENDTLIQLGDIVDGNPQSFECIEELLRIKNLIALRGNHDQWLDEFIQMDYHPMQWNFGGDKTAFSYLKHTKPENNVVFPSGKGYKTSLNASDIPEKHRRFLAGQLLYYIDDLNRCFVHAGFDTSEPFYGQIETNYYFDRSLWMDAMETAQDLRNQHGYISTQIFSEIYIGHTPTTRWNTDQPMSFYNITNLDTGASHSGRLTIMDVDSKDYWQSDIVENLYHKKKEKIKNTALHKS